MFPREAPQPRPQPALAALQLLLGLISLILLACSPAPQDQNRDEALSWSVKLDGAGGMPQQLTAGERVDVGLQLENLGEQTWMAGGRDRLSYHWLNEAGDMVVRDGLRTLLPRDVAPHTNLRLRAQLEAPKQPGRYQLEWAMVRERVRWFPTPKQARYYTVSVEPEAQPWCWSIVRLELPEIMHSGTRVQVPVTVRNCGQKPWQPELGDRFAYHLWGPEGAVVVKDGRRTPLAGTVAPGAEVELKLDVELPRGHARLYLDIEPLREGRRWYGAPSAGSQPPMRELVVLDGPEVLVLDEVSQGRWSAGSRRPLSLELLGMRAPIDPTTQVEVRWSQSALAAGAQNGRLAAESETPAYRLNFYGHARAPRREGDYEVSLWLRHPGKASIELLGHRQHLHIAPSDFAWDLIDFNRPAVLAPGQRIKTEITIRNTGKSTWSPQDKDALAYHWLDADGGVLRFDGLRTKLPGPVAPGETIQLKARLKAPRHTGLLTLQWDMVREGQRWYRSGGPDARDGHWVYIYPKHLGSGLFLALLAPICLWLMLRYLRRDSDRKLQVALALAPLLWAAFAIAWACDHFYALAGVEIWKSGRWAAASAVACLLWPAVLLRPRARRYAIPLTVSSCHGLALADLLYFHFFGGIVPVSALGAAHQVGHIGPSIWSLVEAAHLWFALLPLASLVFIFAPFEAAPTTFASSGARRFRPQFYLVGFLVLASLPAWLRWAELMPSKVGRLVYSETRNVGRLGLMGAHALDILRSGRAVIFQPTIDEATKAALGERVAQRIARRAQEAPPPALVSAPEHTDNKPYNLLLIQVEALQEFVLDLEVEGQEITPNLNRIHHRGLRFTQVVDQSAEGKTSDAEYLVLNSQHPLERGAVCFLRADREFYTLAHLLSDHGYSTFSSHPFERSFWNRSRLHPRYGFTDSMFRRELGPGLRVGWGLADGLFFERIVEHLPKLEAPWFTFLITLSLHHPYDHFPAQLEALDLGEWQGTDVGNYLHAMHYFDRALEQLLADLERLGLAERTVVALYGDHDARFQLAARPELHKLLRMARPEREVHMRSEFVPFVIIPPRGLGVEGAKVEELGGQIDIGPTILALMGIRDPRAHYGRALGRAPASGYAAYPDGSAYGSELLWLPEMLGIRGDTCLDRASGQGQPREACAQLAAQAQHDLRDSRLLLDHDLMRGILSEDEVAH